MTKKPKLGPNFGLFGPNFGPPNFFAGFSSTSIVPRYHLIPFKRKLMNQTWENGQKTNIRPDFGPFGPNVDLQTFFVGLTSTRC